MAHMIYSYVLKPMHQPTLRRIIKCVHRAGRYIPRIELAGMTVVILKTITVIVFMIIQMMVIINSSSTSGNRQQ